MDKIQKQLQNRTYTLLLTALCTLLIGLVSIEIGKAIQGSSDRARGSRSEEFEYLQRKLGQGGLSRENREKYESQLRAMSVQETIQAEGWRQLTAIPTQAQGRRPTVIPPTPPALGNRITGIIENPSGPFSTMDYHLTNAWQEYINNGYILVFAGSLARDPEQGVLLVYNDAARSIHEYLIPGKSGEVRITNVHGFRLVLEGPWKTIFYFDVPGRAFAASIEDVVPTVTPIINVQLTSTPGVPYP